MYYIKLCSMVLLLGILAFSCRRKPDPVTEPENTAGKGGNATLKVIARHHTKDIDSATVYIKYNATDAVAIYDDSTKAVHNIDGEPEAKFEGLKIGKYYLYGRGWDTTISNTVVGGIPFTVSEEKTYEISLPVTEGD